MYDVAIIGGGPAGSTVGTMLRRYGGDLDVVILEREKFPRDHVGESLQPAACGIIHEMGVWDKIERAGFPVKIGATYRWGTDDRLWDVEFVPGAVVQDCQRPSPFQGVRAQTALQVDRAIYDKILLDHAGELGCEVREETRVKTVEKDGDRVTGLVLDDGSKIEARYYVDATGSSGLLRRAMGVDVESPTALRNIAMWDYWQNAEWAVEIGVDGTRVLILSLEYGWLWFIPLSPTRTSVGFICPAEYYKKSGMTPEELYNKALSDEKVIAGLIENAERENKFQTTSDWSYIADRLVGENWFLAGDSCGFADPVLSAGIALAQNGARHCAFTIMSLEDGELDPMWLKDAYNKTGRARIRQHVMFADLWYGGNGCFTDLKEQTREIAETAGLSLDGDKAFRWLATGGFVHDDPSAPFVGGFSLTAVRGINDRLCETRGTWATSEHNKFVLDLGEAEIEDIPILYNGQVVPRPCFVKEHRYLPQYGYYGVATALLKKYQYIDEMVPRLEAYFSRNPTMPTIEHDVQNTISAIEAMVAHGWVTTSYDPDHPLIKFALPEESEIVHTNKDLLWLTPEIN